MNANDRLRLEAAMNTKAQRLFQDGYLIKQVDEHTLLITSDEGTKYEISTLWETCECPCFQQHGNCKHWLGWKQLLEEQTAWENAQEEEWRRNGGWLDEAFDKAAAKYGLFV